MQFVEAPQSFIIRGECEKAAWQNGFRCSFDGPPGWAGFASTTVPGTIHLAAAGPHPRFEEQDGVRVLLVRCEPGPREASLKDGQLQRFFVRGSNATAELQGNAITEYVKQRFGMISS